MEEGRWMTRRALEDEIEKREEVAEHELLRPRYDMSLLARLTYRIRQLDHELLARDAGGC